MGAGGDIRVYFGFEGDIEDHSTWEDVTDDVIDASLTFGRTNPADQWGSNQSWVLLRDLTRDYDPLNTAGTHYPIETGILALIYVRDDTDANVRTMRGVVRKWEPSYWAGDEAGTVLVTIGDLMSVLNQPMPYFADDWVVSKIEQGPAAVYAFNSDYVDTSSGIVADLSGQGRHGFAVTDWTDDTTTGATLAGSGESARLELGSTDTFHMGIEPLDPLAAGNGMFFYLETKLDSTAASTFSGVETWTLGSGGRNSSNHNYWELFITRVTATDVVDLVFRYAVKNETDRTHTMRLTSDTPLTDYITTKRRLFGFGISTNVVTLFAATTPGTSGDGELDGSASTLLSDTFTYRYPGTHEDQSGELWDTWLGRENASAASSTTMDVYRAGIVHTAADEAFCVGFAESYRDRGAMDLDGSERLDTVIDQLAQPATFHNVAISSPYALSPVGYLGFTTVLDFARSLVTMGRGRLFIKGNFHGRIRIEDEDATPTSSGATWSDQGVEPGWKAGSAVINTSYDDTINDVSVAIPNGYVARAIDQTSIDKIGVRSRAYRLPFAFAADADTYATGLIARFKEPELSVSLTVEPVVSSDHWENLDDCNDIGDTVVWEHQALATGPVVTTTMELGGETWSWSQEFQHWIVRLHLEPHRT